MKKNYTKPQVVAINVETESILQESLQRSSERADLGFEVLSNRRSSVNDEWDE